MRVLYTFFVFLFLSSSVSLATHLMGGEIRATHISGQTYKISVQLYLDAANATSATNAQNSVTVCFGDGTVSDLGMVSSNMVPENNDIVAKVYEGNHTYASSGTFQISVSENNRSANILNFPNSVLTPMFIWTVINTQQANSTPDFPNLSFTAGIRQVFTVNLKPKSTDSDSISYKIVKVSIPSPGTCGVRMTSHDYLYPNDVSKSGTFKIDQINKTLSWNAPELAGNYLFAVLAYEWRDGVTISETYREGVIRVTDKPGETVTVPPYQPAENPGVITGAPDFDHSGIAIAVEAYPIPTQDYLTVTVYNKIKSKVNIQIIDINGRVINELQTSSPEITVQQQFDLRKYVPGLYIVRASNGNQSATKKIVR
ncbi:hypothetical protein DYBT9275_02047 [Dyadobacter sp. CECT 9275]|uniref:Secretion system C-terminal sorting domain-containing protein n=1 Tax=Dyadobacter helix TaxID=2822344 RepID=A0A916JAX8_9BACT|nr:T9SS type A sorting domain-containing protein [Dyadobacter sp. CECT 9275]CAG4998648.1 hypothetical protein DYBT9275_02047 [Dyadobacter sp. CECT 9275]